VSEFRDRVSAELINAVGHPIPTHAGLVVLKHALEVKVQEALELSDAPEEFISGLMEAKALISNLRNDIAQEYGIEEGNKHG
jgi:hypothetical protein